MAPTARPHKLRRGRVSHLGAEPLVRLVHFESAHFGRVNVGGQLRLAFEHVMQQRKQAGFAAAVGPRQADFPVGVNLPSGGVDEHLGGSREAQLAELDHVGTRCKKPLLYGVSTQPITPAMKVRAPHTLIVLATLLAGPTLHAQEEDARALRDNAGALRANAEQAFMTRSAACYDKFFVNACLDKARQERTRAVINARKLEARANRIARAKRVEAMEKRLRESGVILPPPDAAPVDMPPPAEPPTPEAPPAGR